MKEILLLIKLSAKKAFQILRERSPLYCEALEICVHVTRSFYNHITFARERDIDDQIERFLIILLIEDVVRFGSLVEVRKMGRKQFFRLSLTLKQWNIVVIVEERSKGYFVYSCFIEHERK